MVKGLLTRHLRWWASKPDIFHSDGTLNIGFSFPNAYMCEDYNSPQSPYWAMKSFVMLALPPDHEFWTAAEATLPEDQSPLHKAVRAPHQILCNTGSHHFLLSSGQFCPWSIKASEAKYCKFAYSSAFGFSVPTGPLLQQMAPDNTLALSIDGGDTWKTRWRLSTPKWGTAFVKCGVPPSVIEELPILRSGWRPWPTLADVTVETVLIPPAKMWPDYHVRVHRISWSRDGLPAKVQCIKAVEGGFGICDRRIADGRRLPRWSEDTKPARKLENDEMPEGVRETAYGCMAVSKAGVSAVFGLDLDEWADSGGVVLAVKKRPAALKPDSNTNLMEQKTVIPTIEYEIPVGPRQREAAVEGEREECILAVAVFATTYTEIGSTLANTPGLYLKSAKGTRGTAATWGDEYIEVDW